MVATSMETAVGSFCWVELATTDVESAATFYAKRFRWSRVDLFGVFSAESIDYVMMHLDGRIAAGLCGVVEEQRSSGFSPRWLPYVRVVDMNRTVARAETLGAKTLAGPLDVFAAGRMAILEDPTGASLGLWQPNDHPGFSVAGEPGSACFFELATGDPSRAARFYSRLFGWEPHPRSSGHDTTVLMHGGRRVGGLKELTREMGDAPSWLSYFGVEDAVAATRFIEAHGGRVCVALSEGPPVGRRTVVEDPQGARFGLLEPRGS